MMYAYYILMYQAAVNLLNNLLHSILCNKLNRQIKVPVSGVLPYSIGSYNERNGKTHQQQRTF